jgi:hypothetical protein
MTITVTMLQTRQGEGGSLWTAGNSYSASDAFAALLIASNLATGALPAVPSSGLTSSQIAATQALVSAGWNSAAILVIGGDHPYEQWCGGSGKAQGMAQLYADYGIKPYLAINTDGAWIGRVLPSETYMTYGQMASIADKVEYVNHGHRHFGHWSRANTGIKITYSGASGTATVNISTTQLTLTAGGGGEDKTITFSADDTIAKVAAAINAATNWTCSIDEILYGTEASTNLLPLVTARTVKTPTTNQYFCAGGGIHLRYYGRDYESITVTKSASNLFGIWADGKMLNPGYWNLTTGSYDTLAELVAAINALGVTNLTAERQDEGATGVNDNYSPLGDELSSALLNKQAFHINGECQNLSAGLTRDYIIERNISKGRETALANGVTLNHFAQSGTKFGKSLIGGETDARSFRGGGMQPGRQIAPGAHAADSDRVFRLHSNIKSTRTRAQAVAAVRALADSPGFMADFLIHKLLPDGSSGYALPTRDLSYYDMVEADFVAMLGEIKTQVQAGKLVTMTPSEASVFRNSRSPTNLIYNPKFQNSGASLLGYTSSSDQDAMGWHISGWRLVTAAQITAMAIDSAGVITITSDATTAAKVLQQEVALEPGVSYEFGFDTEYTSITSNSGARVSIESDWFRQETQRDPTISSSYVSNFHLTNGRVYGRFVCPALNFSKAVVKSKIPAGNIYDLSAAYNIQVNYFGIGATADIDCRGATPASTTAQEIADKINAAVKATAAYAAWPQLWNVATAETKQVVIRIPWNNTSTSLVLAVQSGSSLDALNTIFGTGTSSMAGISDNGPAMGPQLYPYRFVIELNVNGTVKVRRPFLRAMRFGNQ